MNHVRRPQVAYLVLIYYLGFLALLAALYLVKRSQGAGRSVGMLAFGVLALAIPALLWLVYYRVVLPLAWLVRLFTFWSHHQRMQRSLALASGVSLWLLIGFLAITAGYLIAGWLILGLGLGIVSIAYESRIELMAWLNAHREQNPTPRE